MKKILFLSIIALLAITTTVSAQQPRQRKSPHDTLTVKDIKITYGRPYKKGREIFGVLEKYDSVWRVGADEATEITFSKDVQFGGKPVKAGTYTLFAIPRPTEWTIILNGELKQWGAYSYAKNKEKDVLHVNVPSKKLDNVVEQLTLSFTKKNVLVIEWDQTHVEIPIK
ncbi:MAG: DUF2911 domain-containing protein [Chitinophagaceae bacterium]